MPDKTVKEFLALAHERWKRSADAESESRENGLDDLKFSFGLNQWNSTMKKGREASNRPCLTINRIGQSVEHVVNNQRQQRPAIQINPAGDGSSKDVADVLQGIVRHIEVRSDAEVARDIAFENMLRTGKPSPWRIITEFVDDDGSTNDQEIRIESILSTFTGYDDPGAVKPDRSDRKFYFFVEDMSHDEYKAEYPDSELAGLTDMSSVGDSVKEWGGKESIRVAEYFYVDYEEVQGTARKFLKQTVKWAKINAIEILEGNEAKTAGREWAGKFIPVPVVVGKDSVIDGKRYTAGLTRDAKDAQKMYNYWRSAATEAIALAPKAPFIGWKGQFDDPKWESANTENYAYLEANPVNIDGLPTPSLPQRNSVETPIEGFVKLIQLADNDIKATTGIYDASLGAPGPEESGKAILQRKQQGDNATYGYTDNLVRTMRFEGRCLLDLIPKIYTVPRIQRIINPDGSADHVGIWNSTHPDSKGLNEQQVLQQLSKQNEAIKKVFDIGVGKYDVTISIGPSYQTKRQEAAATQLELMKNVPIVQQAAPDIVIRNMDIPGADAIADRVEMLLPPQVMKGDDGSPEMKAQQSEAKAQQLMQQNQVLMQQLGQAVDEIKTKKVEQDGKLQIEKYRGALQIVLAKIRAGATVVAAEITTKAQSEQARAEGEQDEFAMLHDAAHELGIEAMKHQNTVDLSAQGHAQNLEAADQGAAHASDAAQQQAALNPPAEQGAGSEGT